MRNLFISVICFMLLFSCNKNEEEENTNNNNQNNPETMILGRWKIYSITQTFQNSTCTCKVYNINYPNSWIEFTNNPLPDLPSYKILNNGFGLVSLFFKNIKCQTYDFSSLVKVSLDSLINIDTITPSYFVNVNSSIAVPNYYSFSSDKNYLYMTWNFKIELLNSTDLILSSVDMSSFFTDYNNLTFQAETTILHLKKL